MNRENCKAILANIELIRHFADGGDIGHQAKNCAGEEMPIHIAKGIGLGSIHPDGSTYYVRLKPHYVMSPDGTPIRISRAWPETAKKSDVILCNHNKVKV